MSDRPEPGSLCADCSHTYRDHLKLSGGKCRACTCAEFVVAHADQPEPYTLAEAEVLAREAAATAWWANSIMREYDRRGEKIEEMREKLRDIEMLEAQGE